MTASAYRVPQGWQIQDLNNSGSILSEETTQGYEGSMLAPAEMTATSSGLSSLPPMVGQVLDSFELIVAPEVEQSLTRQSTMRQTEAGEDTSSGSDATDDDDDGGGAGGGDDDDDDDDGIGIG